METGCGYPRTGIPPRNCFSSYQFNSIIYALLSLLFLLVILSAVLKTTDRISFLPHSFSSRQIRNGMGEKRERERRCRVPYHFLISHRETKGNSVVIVNISALPNSSHWKNSQSEIWKLCSSSGKWKVHSHWLSKNQMEISFARTNVPVMQSTILHHCITRKLVRSTMNFSLSLLHFHLKEAKKQARAVSARAPPGTHANG